MISLEERKLALFIQTNLLKKELENLQQYDHVESQLNTYKGLKAYTGLFKLVAGLDKKED